MQDTKTADTTQPKTFKYPLGSTARLTQSGERGTIIARAEYLHADDCYYLRYTAADGCLLESWWGESAIAEIEDN